jgi:UDP-GlcNAc:undecaprenyl-phosphate GlcNAc-1-phosphate transferase
VPKLIGQVVSAMFPVFAGVAVFSFTLPFLGRVGLDHILFHNVFLLGNVKVGHLLTIVGFVAVMNIINFIDGVDGLAAGVCVIASATFAVIALSLNRTGAGVLAALTAGGSLGFLRRGFPPASSFMGDTGSNLLGYLLAAVTVLGSLKTNAVVALFFPLCVLAVPILDSGFVIAKRIKHRQPIYAADRSHFHHRMANIGFSQRRTLVYLYGWALVLAGLALALRFVPYSDNHGHFDPLWTAIMAAFGVAAVAASVYLLLALEILKLRLSRFRELVGLGVPVSAPEEVDSGVARELETGSFPAVDPDTGEFMAVERDR